VVAELARRGADVSGRDSRLSTPLHLVAMRGYQDVGRTLIEVGREGGREGGRKGGGREGGRYTH